MKKLKVAMMGICMVVSLSVLLGQGKEVLATESENYTINSGVKIGETDMSGKSQEEAAKELEEHFVKLGNKEISFLIGKNEVKVKATELGLEWKNPTIVEEAVKLGKDGNIIERYKIGKDIEIEGIVYELEYSFDKAKVLDVLNQKCLTYDTEPKDAILERVADGFEVTDSVEGIKLNVEESATNIMQNLTDSWGKTEEIKITLVYNSAEPKVKSEDINLIKDELGSFTTNYSTAVEGRTQNLETATGKINGTILYPGEEYSASLAMEPFTVDNGYAYGAAFEGGEVVQTLGGGVCQVSTTLYNAVLRAELEVLARSNHTMRVGYVEQAADAAIAEGLMDFQFKNDSEYPVYIEGYVAYGQITFAIYGHETRPADRTIHFWSEITGTTPAGAAQIKATGAPFGSIVQKQNRHDGSTARLWKDITENGVTTTVQVNSSTYLATPDVFEVGTAGLSGEDAAALHAAIGTSNMDAVHAAIAAIKNKPAETEAPPETEKPTEKPPEAPAGNPPANPPAAETEPSTETEAPPTP